MDGSDVGPHGRIDIGLSARTYWVWKRVAALLELEWDRLSAAVEQPRPDVAWRREVAVERFHASILRRLAQRALEAGEPRGEGALWRQAGGDMGHWLELGDLLRTLRAHREIEVCHLLAIPEEPSDPHGGPPPGPGDTG